MKMADLENFVWNQWEDGLRGIVPKARGIRGILGNPALKAFLTPEWKQYVTGMATAGYKVGQSRAGVDIERADSPWVKQSYSEDLVKNILLFTSTDTVTEIEKTVEKQFGYVPFAHETANRVTVRACVGKLLGVIAAQSYYLGMAKQYEDFGKPDMARSANAIAAGIRERYSAGDIGIVPLGLTSLKSST